MSSLALEKQALRDRAQRARNALSPASRRLASQAAGRSVLALAHPRRRVALYAAVGSEIDPSTIEAQIEQEGGLVAFPRVEARELVFAEAWSRTLVPGGFGLAEPSREAPLVELGSLDYILVPALLYSASTGHRLGYGKGFFDRALGGLLDREPRPLFVGFAFEAQVQPELPFGDHDVPVDVLVTEARTILYSAVARARL